MKDPKIRIFIADDHALMRIGLKTMLNAQPDMLVVGEAEDGRQAVSRVGQLKPDVVVMDLMMPVMGGDEATQRILSENGSVRVLILTSFSTSPNLQRAIGYGACGVQLKENPTKDIVTAVRALAHGEKAILPEIADLLVDKPAPAELTEKQAHILKAVIRGLTTKEIAAQHNLSEGGVKKHLKLIFAKLGAKSRAEAIGLALKKQLLKI